jgi:hypothetical protein
MANPAYRKKDDNGKLDIEKIRSVEISVIAKPNQKLLLGFKNLRWVTSGASVDSEKESGTIQKLWLRLKNLRWVISGAFVDSKKESGTISFENEVDPANRTRR